MPEEFVVEVEGVETTVVIEEGPDEPSPFALIGASGVGESGPVAGGGGHPDFGAGPVGVVVDGSTGEVVGSVTVNPATGVAESSVVETTVVEETASPPGPPSSAGGGPSVDPETAQPTPPAPQPGDGDHEQDVVFGVVPPSKFIFKPVNDEWMETDCVKIVFVKPTMLGPGTIAVGVVVQAPRWLSENLAAEDASEAATETGRLMLKQLAAGIIGPAHLQVRFWKEMLTFIRGAHPEVGFRVKPCIPA